MTDVMFSNNQAGNNGGGLFNWIGSSPSLRRVTFENNRCHLPL
ncbi:MAG: hypothetical protein ACOYYS_19920 [Chloroflexota bacterium]